MLPGSGELLLPCEELGSEGLVGNGELGILFMDLLDLLTQRHLDGFGLVELLEEMGD